MIQPDAPFFADVAQAPAGAQGYWLTAADGTRLRAVVWASGGAGTVAIFPGRSEYAEKYGHVAAELCERGHSVAVIDWRGQGLSDRHPSSQVLGYVEDFRHYQQDVAAFSALKDHLGLPGPRVLLAHSMGGCIGLRAMMSRGDFEGAVFSAPMWQLHIQSVTGEVLARLSGLASAVGFGARLTPGARPQPSTLAYDFEANALTGDRAMYAAMMAQLRAHPELGIGGPSLQWTAAAFGEMTRLALAPPPEGPAMVLLGTEETVVWPAAIQRQVERMPGADLVAISGAKHEVLMETPEIRARAWDAIDRFIAGLSTVPRAAVSL